MSKYGIELTPRQLDVVETYLKKNFPNEPELDPYFWLAWNGFCETMGDDKLENGFTREEATGAFEKAINDIMKYLEEDNERTKLNN